MAKDISGRPQTYRMFACVPILLGRPGGICWAKYSHGSVDQQASRYYSSPPSIYATIFSNQGLNPIFPSQFGKFEVWMRYRGSCGQLINPLPSSTTGRQV